jgi:hypothetical protein
MWGALSDEWTGLSFTIAARARQRSHSRVRVPWGSWTYFTVSDSRLPFSLPPMTRRDTVEVFDPASKVKVTLRLTVGQSVSLGVEPHLVLMTLWQLRSFFWGDFYDERTGLSFVYAAGPRQRSFSRARVPWHSWPYFTASYLRLPFSSPPTTRRVTVEVCEPASTRLSRSGSWSSLYSLGTDRTENTSCNIYSIAACYTADT